MADKITINEAYLKSRITDFTNYEADSADRSTNFTWTASDPSLAVHSVSGNLSADPQIRAGAAAFQPTADLVAGAKAVQTNFSTRMSQFNEQSGFLADGLQALVDNSQHIEDLNTMTADDFGYYVDETTSGGGTTNPPTTGQ